MRDSTIKWVLFCLMAATVPVLYYMFVIGGYLPLSAIAALSFTGVWGFKLFNAVHLLIYGALFYWVARLVSRKLALLPRGWKVLGFASLSAALVAVAFLPVYGVGQHEFQPVNLYRLFNDLFGPGYAPTVVRP